MSSFVKSVLCIPTLNAGKTIGQLLAGLRSQIYQVSELLVIDSDSTDDSADIFRDAGAIVYVISRASFNHGRTRQMALECCSGTDIIVYMTQDAILASPDSVKNILTPFKDEKVGAVCGRQIPYPDASPIAAHARLFNYQAVSSVKSKDDIKRIGIKAAFLSNSFAAYRRTALMDVGGFPSNIIFGEDTYVAARMLLAGWKVAYAAEASCYHSHNYSIVEEFRRYFDIGIFHSQEKWFIDLLGKAEGEGKKFVLSEFKYLLKKAPWLIPSAMLRTLVKLMGYKLGQMEHKLPSQIVKRLSMNKGYWMKG